MCVAGTFALPFVISTEAERSGEISVLTTSPGNVSRERSEVWRDLLFLFCFSHILFRPVPFRERKTNLRG
jgi:hypothetical protein